MKSVINQIYSGAWNNIEYSASVKKTFNAVGVISAIGILGSIFILLNKKKMNTNFYFLLFWSFLLTLFIGLIFYYGYGY